MTFSSSIGETVSVSDVKWSCTLKDCDVKFSVKNNSPVSVETTAILRGQNKTGGKGKAIRDADESVLAMTHQSKDYVPSLVIYINAPYIHSN